MGKLKETLLNNLTPEEMDERYELSAFEYVEYIEKYKKQNEEIPDDVVQQLGEEQQKLEQEYYEQQQLDIVNDSMRVKYTDSDILYVLERYVPDSEIRDNIMAELNDVWNTKNGFFE